MNFRIVENPTPEYVEKYDEFVELYNDLNVKVSDVHKILGWSTNTFEQAKARALEEGRIELRKPYMRNKWKKGQYLPKNYSYDRHSGKYIVKKTIFNKDTGVSDIVYFGIYSKEEVAKRIVEELRGVDWDKNELDNIRDRVKLEFGLKYL